MRIEALSVQNFRNYATESFTFHPSYNLICGENAQGKTNLLEAMVYLSCGVSPRTRFDRELIRFGETQASLTALSCYHQRQYRTEIVWQKGRKRSMKRNGVTLSKGASLSETLRTVYFCPEDLSLIRAGAAERRRFLDIALSQLRPKYAEALTHYQRLHEQKTRILREAEEHPDWLQVLPEFNEGLVQWGAILLRYRAKYCRELQRAALPLHTDCSGGRERLQLCYRTVSTVTDPFAPIETIQEQLRRHMSDHQAAERHSRSCLSGVHKDDLEVLLNDAPARSFGSQGQTRTAALVLKLAERQLSYEDTGDYPLLLLDDVLSELDPRRQEFVLNRIAGGQVFLSCCEEEKLERFLSGQVLSIADGHWQREA